MLARKNKSYGEQSISEIVKRNTAVLYKRDWKQTDKQGKSVYNVTSTGKATVATMELIAEKSNIPAWYLLLPLSEESLLSNDLNELVSNYIISSPETKKSVLHLLKVLNP